MTTPLYGLLERDLKHIEDAVKSMPEIEKLILFGSRAKGTYKLGSDIDLAIKGVAVTYETVVRLSRILNEEKPIPYFVDIVDYNSISEQRLIDHIDRVGIELK